MKTERSDGPLGANANRSPAMLGRSLSGFGLGLAVVLALLAFFLVGFAQIVPAIVIFAAAMVLGAVAGSSLIAVLRREDNPHG